MCARAGKSPNSPRQTATVKSIPAQHPQKKPPTHNMYCGVPYPDSIALLLLVGRKDHPLRPEQIHAMMVGSTTGSPHHKEDVEGNSQAPPSFML